MNISCQNTYITIDGLVDTVKVSEEIHRTIKNLLENHRNEEIILDFKDTFVITSSLIGSLLGLVQKEKVNLKLIARNNELYSLLDKLNLIQTFNVKTK